MEQLPSLVSVGQLVVARVLSARVRDGASNPNPNPNPNPNLSPTLTLALTLTLFPTLTLTLTRCVTAPRLSSSSLSSRP